MNLSGFDVFASIVGGLKIAEPAIDLGLVTAISSSFREKIVDPECVVMGEVGLGAEVRRGSQIDSRINEAEKLGFKRCILPKANIREVNKKTGIELSGVGTIEEALKIALRR